jgi:hypothetical protein
MSAADDYESLDVAFPLAAAGTALGETVDDAPYWTIVMHGSILRKFFQSSDKLHLDRVVTSLRAVVPDDATKVEKWEYLRTGLSQIESIGEHIYDGCPGRGEMEILEHELYGRHLHGDYGKWALRVPNWSGSFALHLAVTRQAQSVRWLAGLVRGHVDRHLLDLD